MPNLDSLTLVLLTAFQLIATGTLGLIYSRRLRIQGAHLISGSLLILGSGFLVRSLTDPASTGAATVFVDCLPVLAVLLLEQGLRAFHGSPKLAHRGVALFLAAYGIVHLVLLPRFGVAARVLLQTCVVGTLLLFVALDLVRETRRQTGARRHPLILLTILAAGQGVAAWVRFLHVAHGGTDLLYRGPVAQIFYLYVSLTALLLSLCVFWMFFASLHAELAERAARDALTNCLNRHGLDRAMHQHFRRRARASLVLLQVDVDHFKRINDTWGHDVGDAVLCAVCDTLRACVRESDFVARIGGEEFLVGCALDKPAEAVVLAERLRCSVESQLVPGPEGAPIRCTVSIGVSDPILDHTQWHEAQRAADRALYRAKSAGRNCVREAEGAAAMAA